MTSQTFANNVSVPNYKIMQVLLEIESFQYLKVIHIYSTRPGKIGTNLRAAAIYER